LIIFFPLLKLIVGGKNSLLSDKTNTEYLPPNPKTALKLSKGCTINANEIDGSSFVSTKKMVLLR